MHHRWHALVGLAVLTLVVSVAGPRMHMHPVDLEQAGPGLVHAHGFGEPHSHGQAPSTPGDEGEPREAVIVLGAARGLLSSSSVTALTAPVFLPEPAATVAAVAMWTPAPDTTPVRSHSPPSARLLPARAPPPGPLQIS
jgi:hypothetical protein